MYISVIFYWLVNVANYVSLLLQNFIIIRRKCCISLKKINSLSNMSKKETEFSLPSEIFWSVTDIPLGYNFNITKTAPLVNWFIAYNFFNKQSQHIFKSVSFKDLYLQQTNKQFRFLLILPVTSYWRAKTLFSILEKGLLYLKKTPIKYLNLIENHSQITLYVK